MVTAVICAAFDRATDAALLAVRERARDAGAQLPPQPRHRPHFTLAAARIEPRTEADRVCAVAGEVACAHAPIDIVLDTVGRFARAGVLWLGPSPAPALAALQGAVAAALSDAGWPPAFGQRSAPAHWVPHCTIATRLPRQRLRDVHAVLSESYQPIAGSVDALATILVGGRGDVGHAPLRGPAQ